MTRSSLNGLVNSTSTKAKHDTRLADKPHKEGENNDRGNTSLFVPHYPDDAIETKKKWLENRLCGIISFWHQNSDDLAFLHLSANTAHEHGCRCS